MNKTEFIAHLAAKMKMPKTAMTKFVDCFTESVTEVLIKGKKGQEGKLRLLGFGSWVVVYVKKRVVKNPRTGKKMEIDETYKCKFRPGQKLKKTVAKAYKK